MSSSLESSAGGSFFVSGADLTLTGMMDKGFVVGSSPGLSRIEAWDPRSHPKSGGSPFLLKVKESTPVGSGGGRSWLGVEEGPGGLCPSPLPPDAQVLELSSVASELHNPFNNSIVGIFYGTKVSTPCREEEEREEASDPIAVDVTVSRAQASDLLVSAVGLQKLPPPAWEISEINSALEENTPSLDVSISDLRFPSGERDPTQPMAAARCAQWVVVKHKDLGRSFLRPLRYERHLSATEISLPIIASLHLAAVVSPNDRLGEGQLGVTAGTERLVRAMSMCGY
ncbi:hypothetical protein FKM82_020734 [Ascaphus truei]